MKPSHRKSGCRIALFVRCGAFWARAILIALAIMLLSAALPAETWKTLSEGISIAYFDAPLKSGVEGAKISVIKVNPHKVELKLLCASQFGENLSAKEWCRDHDLLLACNAGMFLTDYKTNVGYLKSVKHYNNRRINPKYFSIAAFNPKKADLPLFKIFDSDVEEADQIIEQYDNVVQNLRLIKRPRENRWSQQERRWSELALGQDRAGNLLILFCRAPYSMYDFNQMLLQLPIDLVCAQHLEGGPEAQVYLKCGTTELELVGSYESNYSEHNGNTYAWRIPNVIGIAKK